MAAEGPGRAANRLLCNIAGHPPTACLIVAPAAAEGLARALPWVVLVFSVLFLFAVILSLPRLLRGPRARRPGEPSTLALFGALVAWKVIHLLALLGLGFLRLNRWCMRLAVAIAERFELEGAGEIRQALFPSRTRPK